MRCPRRQVPHSPLSLFTVSAPSVVLAAFSLWVGCVALACHSRSTRRRTRPSRIIRLPFCAFPNPSLLPPHHRQPTSFPSSHPTTIQALSQHCILPKRVLTVLRLSNPSNKRISSHPRYHRHGWRQRKERWRQGHWCKGQWQQEPEEPQRKGWSAGKLILPLIYGGGTKLGVVLLSACTINARYIRWREAQQCGLNLTVVAASAGSSFGVTGRSSQALPSGHDASSSTLDAQATSVCRVKGWNPIAQALC